jgi:hypothetical protein
MGSVISSCEDERRYHNPTIITIVYIVLPRMSNDASSMDQTITIGPLASLSVYYSRVGMLSVYG